MTALITPVDVDVPPDIPAESLAGLAAEVSRALRGARIWHVNSTANGGGVAELLHASIGRHRVLGLPTSWLVTDAPAEFFDLTKRVHHGLHGRRDPGPFVTADHDLYRSVTACSADALLGALAPGDVVVLHDPQTLGAAPRLVEAGVRVAWRCHIGSTVTNAITESVWSLLGPYLADVPLAVFTLAEYVPSFVSADRWTTILPSIDPTAAKNRDMSVAERDALLGGIGLIANGADRDPLGHVVQDAPLPPDADVVLQLSRWDPLKDMVGVLAAFAGGIAAESTAHLVLAGPDPADIPDDPEGAAVYADVRAARAALPPAVRARTHLAMLSLRRFDANGRLVNALQRRASVIGQKSLAEGFGLTVTEAMWKSRPVVGARVGGIPAQLTDGVDGVLVEPTDLDGFAGAVCRLLADPAWAGRIGAAAHRRCADAFLVDRELGDYLRLYLRLLA